MFVKPHLLVEANQYLMRSKESKPPKIYKYLHYIKSSYTVYACIYIHRYGFISSISPSFYSLQHIPKAGIKFGRYFPSTKIGGPWPFQEAKELLRHWRECCHHAILHGFVQGHRLQDRALKLGPLFFTKDHERYISEPRKKQYYFPLLYWLFNKDPCTGIL